MDNLERELAEKLIHHQIPRAGEADAPAEFPLLKDEAVLAKMMDNMHKAVNKLCRNTTSRSCTTNCRPFKEDVGRIPSSKGSVKGDETHWKISSSPIYCWSRSTAWHTERRRCRSLRLPDHRLLFHYQASRERILAHGCSVPAGTTQSIANELATLRQRTNRSTTLTFLVGILALALLCVYFYYGYTQISTVMTPDNLVTFAFTQLDNEVPNLTARIEKEVKEGAPQWANQLSKQVVDAIPNARKELEQHALKEAEKGLKEVNVMTDDKFRKFMKDNHPELDQMFKDLASNDPKLAEGHLKKLEAMADKEMQKDMQAQMAEFMTSVNMAHQQLKKLKEGKKLTASEEPERNVAMILRRLQSEHIDTDKPIPGPPRHDEETGGKDSAPAGRMVKRRRTSNRNTQFIPFNAKRHG